MKRDFTAIFRYMFLVCILLLGLVAVTGSGGGDGDDNDGDMYINSLDMTFKRIPSGIFTMGSPVDEAGRLSDETQHEVTLTQSYYMQTTEVTQGQWEAVMESNPSYFSNGEEDFPVEQVSWDEAQEFIAKLNLLGEGTYRLPTEAEWEYAARAGSTKAFANGGITLGYEDYALNCISNTNLDAMGWYCDNSDEKTHPVAGKQANAWDLYDMHGNVSEWCQDWCASALGSASVADPTGATSGSLRVIRGGSWLESAQYCRSASRLSGAPSHRNSALGFRLVRVPGQL